MLRESFVNGVVTMASRCLEEVLGGGDASTSLLHQSIRLLRNLSSGKQHVLCIWGCNVIDFIFDVVKRIISMNQLALLEHCIAFLSNMCVDPRAVASMESKSDVIPFIYEMMMKASTLPATPNDAWMNESFIVRQCCAFFAELLPIDPTFKDKLRESPKYSDIFPCFRRLVHVYGLDLSDALPEEMQRRCNSVLESATCCLATLTANGT